MRLSDINNIVREEEADYTDPHGRFVVVSENGAYKAIGIGQYGDVLPITQYGFKTIGDAIDYAEEILDIDLDEGYFQQSVDKVAKDWNERIKTGKWPDERGDDSQLITYLNDKGKKVTGRVARKSTNSPRGYFLDTGEFVSQQRVISKEAVSEAEGWVSGAKLVKKGGELGLKFPKIGTVFGVGEMISYNDEDGYITGFSKNGTKVQVEIDREHGTKKYWWPIDGVEQHWDTGRVAQESLEESDPMNPPVGNYDLDTLQRKVARDFAQMAETASKAKSRREWNNIMHQLSNNTMYQLEDILDTYETLQARYSKGGANSRGIDKSRLESKK